MNKILLSLKQRALWPIWLLLIIVIILDLKYRFANHLSNDNNDWQIETNQVVLAQVLSPEEAKIIAEILSEYDIAKEQVSAPKSTTLSEAEQAAQQGRINQLYSGDLRFRLVGIFTQQQNFAVLSGKDLASSTDKVLKVKVDEKLGEYLITAILANEIQLLAEDKRQITLKLFKSDHQ